ncbi:MAG: ECF transporter S component [Clostridia bacterium]|nr:ECF transporter S component [Clostridia bacterium]
MFYNEKIKKIALTAMFLSLGFLLPFLTGQIKEIGDTLLPMHIPIMLCGLICGYKYGFVAGAVLPFLRGIIAGMPPLYPNAVWMAAELCVYGGVVGFLYMKFFRKQMWWLYCCLLISMISGRIVWGVTKAVLLGVAGKAFTLQAFLAGGFIDSLPGIVLQLILIPVIMQIINKNYKP